MDKDASGPAFPYSGVHKGSDMNYIIDNHGMTLRDYFAAKALVIAARGAKGEPEGAYYETVDGIASRAYLLADAMLKARG